MAAPSAPTPDSLSAVTAHALRTGAPPQWHSGPIVITPSPTSPNDVPVTPARIGTSQAPLASGRAPIWDGSGSVPPDQNLDPRYWSVPGGAGKPTVIGGNVDFLKNVKPVSGQAQPPQSGGMSPQFQQIVAQLMKNIGTINNTNFTPQVQQVAAQQVGNPFGPHGYQVPIQYENGLAKNISTDEQGLSRDYLANFLPGATQLAMQAYGPSIAAALLQGARGSDTISGYNQGANELLSQIPGQVGQTYNQSIGTQLAVDQGIRKTLAGLNPGTAGLPTSSAGQAQEIANQGRTSFNGGGVVQGGLGDLNALGLNAQKAAAVSEAEQLPALNTMAGRQALVANQLLTQNDLAKINSQASAAGLKLAESQNRDFKSGIKAQLTTDTGLLKTQQSNDFKAIADQIGIDKANATSAQKAAATNATNQLSAIRAGISAKNAAIAQQRYALSLAKAAYPQSTATAQASLAKSAQSFFGVASGSTPKSIQVFDPKLNKSVSQLQNPLSYDDAVRQWATTHGGNIGQAQAFAAGYYNYGQGGRPLDPQMSEALNSAGLNPDFYTSADGKAFMTTDQLAALTKAGYGGFAASLVKTGGMNISVADAAKEGLITPQQAAAAPNSQFKIWIIPPFHSGA